METVVVKLWKTIGRSVIDPICIIMSRLYLIKDCQSPIDKDLQEIYAWEVTRSRQPSTFDPRPLTSFIDTVIERRPLAITLVLVRSV